MFQKCLKQLRESKNLTQKNLAEILNLTQSTIAYYESGKKQPYLNMLEKLSDYFNVSVDYLLGRTDVRQQPETSAAHRVSDPMSDLPPEALDELEKLKQYVLSKYRKDKPSDGK